MRRLRLGFALAALSAAAPSVAAASRAEWGDAPPVSGALVARGGWPAVAGLTGYQAQTEAPAGAITVNEAGDEEDPKDDDGHCHTRLMVRGESCTLRAAIQEANHRPGIDAIAFAVGLGVVRIDPKRALPTLTEGATIDGTTQPGFTGVPVVQLSGAADGAGAVGLRIPAEGATVRGLEITGFVAAPGDPESTLGSAIVLRTRGHHTIAGNYIGIARDGITGAGNHEASRSSAPRRT